MEFKPNRKNSTILDEKITAANIKINEQFYGKEDSQEDDSNLYNMGDSTPILNEDNSK